MIDANSLEKLAVDLRFFDVTQSAWEQEPNGFEANAHHTLTHLVKTLIHKPFDNPEIVQSDIAPDSLMYALRLARWADISPSDLEFSDRYELDLGLSNDNFINSSYPYRLFTNATSELSEHLHSLGHASERDEALITQSFTIGYAGKLLIYASASQASSFKFDLVDAFETRLANLRERFSIPNPNNGQ